MPSLSTAKPFVTKQNHTPTNPSLRAPGLSLTIVRPNPIHLRKPYLVQENSRDLFARCRSAYKVAYKAKMAIKRPARPAAEAPTWVLRTAAPVLEAEAAVPVAEPVAEPVA